MSASTNTGGGLTDISDSVDWKRLQTIALTRMKANAEDMEKRNKGQSDLQNIRMQDPDTMDEVLLSYSDEINEVTELTDLGKKIIVMEIRKLSRIHPLTP